MKFICSDCEKQFLYASKKIEVNIEGETAPMTTTFETHVCPYCHSLNITEAQAEQPQPKGKITALISAPNSNVNDYLEQGYEVMEDKIYAKETILVKREEATQ